MPTFHPEVEVKLNVIDKWSVTLSGTLRFFELPYLKMYLIGFHKCPITSVCLIYHAVLTANSRKTLPDMKIFNAVSDSPTYVPTIPKNFRTKIFVMIEISTESDSHTIAEYHNFRCTLPILPTIHGENVAKTLWNHYLCKCLVKSEFFRNFEFKLLVTSSSIYNQTRFPDLSFVYHHCPVISIPHRL